MHLSIPAPSCISCSAQTVSLAAHLYASFPSRSPVHRESTERARIGRSGACSDRVLHWLHRGSRSRKLSQLIFSGGAKRGLGTCTLGHTRNNIGLPRSPAGSTRSCAALRTLYPHGQHQKHLRCTLDTASPASTRSNNSSCIGGTSVTPGLSAGSHTLRSGRERP